MPEKSRSRRPRQYRRRKAVAKALVVLGALVWAGLVSAAPQIKVEESRLEICKLLEQTPATLTGQLRVSSDVDAELELLASELTLEEGSVSDPECRIGRDKISLAQAVKLEAGKPRDVTIQVRDVDRPGIWTGKLQLRATAVDSEESAAKETSTLDVDIRLELTAPPKVKPVYEERVFRLVRCHSDVSCFVARLLLRESTVRKKWSLVLDNQGPQAVRIEQAKALLLGESTGLRPPVRTIKMQPPEILAANRLTEIPVEIEAADLDPDQYSGEFRFELERADEPVKIRADLFVRQGPMPALLVLLFGIIVGRLARTMQGETARRQVNRYPDLERVKKSARELQDPSSRRIVEKGVSTLERALDRGQLDDDVWTAKLENLESTIRLLAALETLEKKAEGREQLAKKLEEPLREIRALISSGELEKAEKRYQEIRKEFEAPFNEAGMGETANQVETRIAESKAAAEKTPRPSGGGLGPALAWLSGLEKSYQVEIRYWLVRPLLWLTLLAALALLGLEALYVDEATFGAGGVFDFLGLFIWGVTSDIARQGLLTLQRAGQKAAG